ncbi:DoxX family protein [Nocardia cyriacigeorgica]|uniref:DoxX family protein n=1 Tax=Nocardia cyriacigeorgica TaxID=135487 RepID=UPI001893068C|nr:DoxX family protein [Nocardia cyriacigeorgica]MBF6455236.1 DoxX family protein [Nocardia cyriacigeorgica]MBF6480916.1 DoxX family protein [Nocardia cyriacigeorgica]MBF6554022.1 DoxX family protein [Nocardia cyriacigeorgica]
MNVALWIVAGVLAAVLLVSSAKIVIPKEKIVAAGKYAAWAEDFSPSALKALGVVDLLGAVGLILPAVLDIAPILVPVAATGTALLFAGAIIVRIRRGLWATAVAEVFYLAMAVFVAVGRFGLEPFA